MAKKTKLVGRRKLPPKDKRWKKGVSGNPRGRPKKEDCITDLLREESAKVCPSDPKQRTWEQINVTSLIQLAAKGHPTAMRLYWDHMKLSQFTPDGLVTVKLIHEDEKVKDEGEDSDEDDPGDSDTG